MSKEAKFKARLFVKDLVEAKKTGRPNESTLKLRELFDKSEKFDALMESDAIDKEFLGDIPLPDSKVSFSDLIVKLIPLKFGKDFIELIGRDNVDLLEDFIRPLLTTENLVIIAPIAGTASIPIVIVLLVIGLYLLEERWRSADGAPVLPPIMHTLLELFNLQVGLIKALMIALGAIFQFTPEQIINDAGVALRNSLGLPADPDLFVANFERGVHDFISLTVAVLIFGPFMGPVVYQAELEIQKFNADKAKLELELARLEQDRLLEEAQSTREQLTDLINAGVKLPTNIGRPV